MHGQNNIKFKPVLKYRYSSTLRLVRVYSILIVGEASRILLILAADLQPTLHVYNRSCSMVHGELFLKPRILPHRERNLSQLPCFLDVCSKKIYEPE